MIVIDCQDPLVRLVLPPCVAEIETAYLVREGFDAIPLAGAPTDTGMQLTGVPDDIARGVWHLSLSTNCGCYDAPVYVDVCRAPRFEGTYEPTSAPPPTVVCCEDEDAD